jgi:hypothetical protein
MRERAAHATLSGHGQSLFVWSDFGQYIFCKSLACMGKNEVALFFCQTALSSSEKIVLNLDKKNGEMNNILNKYKIVNRASIGLIVVLIGIIASK